MSELMTWGPALLGYAEEIILGATGVLGVAGVLIVKALKLKNQFMQLIDLSPEPNSECEKLATSSNLKLAAKAISLFTSKKS